MPSGLLVADRIDCLDEAAAFQEFIKQKDIAKGNNQCWPYRVPGLPFHGRFLVLSRDAAESIGFYVIFIYAAYPVFKDTMLFVYYPPEI